jgi:hypothetical protein
MGGLAKALWIIFLIFMPFLSMLIYLVARGRGMAERSASAGEQARAAQESYIREVAAGTGEGISPAEEISRAKALLDSGAITQPEFDQLKAKALQHVPGNGAAQTQVAG